jgi:DNA primase catalytic core
MARISDDDLNRMKRNISVAELCRSRGIELKPHGRKDLIGKCPFHEDENPSFVVSPEKNLFHCLGCDAAGSVIDLVMKLDGLDFRQAVDKLLPGLRATNGGDSAPIPKRPALPAEKANALLERVIAIYQKTFTESPDGRKYLEGRGITDGGLFIKHRVGYANGTLKDLLPKDGQLKEELKTLGVLLDNGHERFTGCVIFPVFDPDGRVTTLYGRFTGPEPKRHLFLPERSTGLWNASAVKTYPEIILVESVIDALSVMMAGQPNVIGIQGTNGLNERDAALLREYGAQKITLLLDGDDAGKKAGQKLHEMLSSTFSCRLLTLPDDHDPNSYLQAHGPAKLNELLNAAESGQATVTVRAGGDGQTSPSLSSAASAAVHGGAGLAVTYGMRRYEIRGLEKGPRRLKATIRVEHGGKLHVDTLDFYSARSRQILCQDLCRIYEETPETIEGDLQRLIVECEKHQPTAETRQDKSLLEKLSAKDKEEAETFGKSPDLIERILADFETYGLIGEENNKLLGYIAMTSRKRDTPLSVLILSSSGAGKTALQDAVLAFCPPEDLVKLTALSGKALFYKEQTSLKHKVLALEEGDGAEEASYAIRNLISAKELVSESTIKDLTTGRLTTMENKVEGPTPVFLTTTNPEIDAETKSRFFVTSIDESREQTRKILSFQRRLHESDGLITTPEIEGLLRKHRNFQRLLKQVAVKNPFAGKLTYGDDRLQGRRDQPKYLNLIKAIAFLRQMQKEVFYEQRNGSAVPAVAVDVDDIRLANKLANEILGHSLDELSRPGRDLLLLIEELATVRLKEQQKRDKESKTRPADIPFSRRELREFTGWTNTRLHIHLKELVDFEYIVIEAGRNGLPFRYRLAWEGQGKDGKRFMLGLKDVKDLRPET